jgi:hypothetical protein
VHTASSKEIYSHDNGEYKRWAGHVVDNDTRKDSGGKPGWGNMSWIGMSEAYNIGCVYRDTENTCGVGERVACAREKNLGVSEGVGEKGVVTHPPKKKESCTETVQGAAGPLEGVDDVEGGDGLAVGRRENNEPE